MNIFKKIVAWIVIILAIAGILISVAGLVGSWVVNSTITQVTLNLLTASQNAVMNVNNSVIRIDERLDVTQERINRIDERVINIGDELTESSIIVTVISNQFGDEISPIIDNIRTTANTVRDTATAIDEVIEAVDNIPLVSVEKINPGDNVFTQIVEDIDAIETAIEETRSDLQTRREDTIEEIVGNVTGRTNEVRSRVTTAQDRLGEAENRLATANSNLDALKVRLPRTFLLITILISLMFIFMGIAFLSLIFHAYSYIRNPEQTFRELVA
jgi:chromosome segregation ATPase